MKLLREKIVLGHHGQYGDLFINLAAIRYASEIGAEVTMPINKRYADAAPLFFNQDHINSIIITEGYELRELTEKDKDLLRRHGENGIFNPMNRHQDDWWKEYHQTEMVAADFLKNLNEKDIRFSFPNESYKKLNLTRWFDTHGWDFRPRDGKKWVAFAPFAGFYNQSNDKILLVKNAQLIVNELVKFGLYVLQVGGNKEPKLEGAKYLNTDYFNSVKNILSCDLFIHTDTGLGWAASCYDHPTVGLYSNAYYGKELVKNIQPINPKAKYIDEANVNEITIEKIIEVVKEQLAKHPRL